MDTSFYELLLSRTEVPERSTRKRTGRRLWRRLQAVRLPRNRMKGGLDMVLVLGFADYKAFSERGFMFSGQ